MDIIVSYLRTLHLWQIVQLKQNAAAAAAVAAAAAAVAAAAAAVAAAAAAAAVAAAAAAAAAAAVINFLLISVYCIYSYLNIIIKAVINYFHSWLGSTTRTPPSWRWPTTWSRATNASAWRMTSPKRRGTCTLQTSERRTLGSTCVRSTLPQPWQSLATSQLWVRDQEESVINIKGKILK